MHGFNRVAAAPGEIPGEKVDHIDRRQALACSGITPPKMPLSMENWEYGLHLMHVFGSP